MRSLVTAEGEDDGVEGREKEAAASAAKFEVSRRRRRVGVVSIWGD